MSNVIKEVYKKQVWGFFDRIVEADVQKRIQNKDFTIICPNCLGGVLYHRLGMRFDSPTINTWMYKTDFCKMCSDLPYYMEQELHFYENKIKVGVPSATIGEGNRMIRIDFAHYKTEKEAREKWEDRKARIHWDNIFIMACDGDGATKDDFDLLNGVGKRRIVFTSREHLEISNSFVLKSMSHYETATAMQLTRHPITGLRSWEREFDYVEWLNTGRIVRRQWGIWGR